jgi:hypothetical protein
MANPARNKLQHQPPPPQVIQRSPPVPLSTRSGGALIIGSAARWFLLRSPTFSHLTITIAREDKWALVTYLLSEGYGDDDADDDVEELPPVLTLVKKDGDKSYRIIIISNVCALFGTIQYARTTAEISFIS